VVDVELIEIAGDARVFVVSTAWNDYPAFRSYALILRIDQEETT